MEIKQLELIYITNSGNYKNRKYNLLSDIHVTLTVINNNAK